MRALLLVLVLFTAGCSISWDLDSRKKPEPEWFKALTPAAKEEVKELSKCVYFITADNKVNAWCK
jgi:hypothetical protein